MKQGTATLLAVLLVTQAVLFTSAEKLREGNKQSARAMSVGRDFQAPRRALKQSSGPSLLDRFAAAFGLTAPQQQTPTTSPSPPPPYQQQEKQHTSNNNNNGCSSSTVPSGVNNLNVSTSGSSSSTINVCFQAPSGSGCVDEYRISVKAKDQSSSGSDQYIIAGSPGCYSISGLQSGKEYTASVTTYSKSANGGSTVTNDFTTSTTGAPPPPSGISTTPPSSAPSATPSTETIVSQTNATSAALAAAVASITVPPSPPPSQEESQQLPPAQEKPVSLSAIFAIGGTNGNRQPPSAEQQQQQQQPPAMEQPAVIFSPPPPPPPAVEQQPVVSLNPIIVSLPPTAEQRQPVVALPPSAVPYLPPPTAEQLPPNAALYTIAPTIPATEQSPALFAPVLSGNLPTSPPPPPSPPAPATTTQAPTPPPPPPQGPTGPRFTLAPAVYTPSKLPQYSTSSLPNKQGPLSASDLTGASPDGVQCKTIGQVLAAIPEASQFVQVLKNAGLEGVLLNDPTVQTTVLVPINSAFTAAVNAQPWSVATTMGELLTSAPALNNPLAGYAVLRGLWPTTAMISGSQIDTSTSIDKVNQLKVQVDGNGVIQGAGNSAKILEGNIAACGPSVVHLVDQVLLPFSFDQAPIDAISGTRVQAANGRK